MLAVGFKHQGNVLRKMLAVTVKGNGIGKSHFKCLSETFLQCSSFSGILLQFDQYGPLRQAFQDSDSSVCATVAHNYHIQALGHGSLRDRGNGTGIVVCRYYYAYAT